MKITENDIGKNLWDYVNQKWVRIKDYDEYSIYPVILNNGLAITFSGKHILSDKTPVYFWDKVLPIQEPEKPQRTKIIRALVNEDGHVVHAEVDSKQYKCFKDNGYNVMDVTYRFKTSDERIRKY